MSETFRLYDIINSIGGEWGVSAQDIGRWLDGLPEDTDTITLRINSKGGEVSEALAITNLLRSHPAKVTAVVDGVAASAASFVAAGVDELIMSPHSQLMVHDARANAFLMGARSDYVQQIAEMLDFQSNNIAAIYAAKSGASVEEWRDVMGAETWISDQEAVAAKLADRIAKVPFQKATGGAGTAFVPDALELAASMDLTVFNYAGREQAPAPHIPGVTPPEPPAASAGGSITTEGGSAVAFTSEQITDMRRKLGIAEDADEATILAALTEALDERADPPSTPTTPVLAPTTVANTPTTSTTDQQPAPATAAPAAPGTMVIDSSAWEERENRIRRLEANDAKRRREEHEAVIAQAISDGKFPVARKDHWVRLWNADPEGTREVIAGLQKGVVPVDEIGHANDEEAMDEALAHLYPPETYNQKGA